MQKGGGKKRGKNQRETGKLEEFSSEKNNCSNLGILEVKKVFLKSVPKVYLLCIYNTSKSVQSVQVEFQLNN